MRDRISAYRLSVAVASCLGAAALALCATAASARPGATPGAGVARGPMISHAPSMRAFRHHNRFGGGSYWPGAYAYGTTSEPVAETPPPASTDVHYTYTYDVPWDWAHRYPPNVVPSDRPYVSSCPMETVKVLGRAGEQTVNITRCY